MENINEQLEWQALVNHQQDLSQELIQDWFRKDPERFKKFSLQHGEILLDFSKNHIQSDTINLLCKLAEKAQLKSHIKAFFNGSPINHTEYRPALHSALRCPAHQSLVVNGINIAHEIIKVREKMQRFCSQIYNGDWSGATGKSIKHIVNIGIGGSHHGPLMAIQALKDYAINDLCFHFISTIDPTHFHDVLEKIDIERTVFIISSKSFTTIETLTNAREMITLLKSNLPSDFVNKHFIAVTASTKKALEFGISIENIFPIWDWVGGRYSVWSAIGLPIMLMIGPQQFDEFLSGAYEMDQHFCEAPYHQNLPVMLGLIGLWYINFFNTTAQAIVPYSHRLRHLIPYLQQADMESNGKSVNKQGERVNYRTAPIIFGEEGCDGQHTYHQWLHQAPHFIPVDFILIAHPTGRTNLEQHSLLIASALSQAEALMRGKTTKDVLDELIKAGVDDDEANILAQHKSIPGNRPSTILFLKRLTPKNFGALLALYEHKIFVQGTIWNINSFDQWGVELGKQLLPRIVQQIQNVDETSSFDCATTNLIRYYQQFQKENHEQNY